MNEILTSKDYVYSGKEISLDDTCNAKALRGIVEEFSFSRHMREDGNKKAAEMLLVLAEEIGFRSGMLSGSYNSVEWLWPENYKRPIILGGTHYDTVENCPGADDNASGIAVLVCAAKYLLKNRDRLKSTPMFCFFNGEEEGLLGSNLYVKKRMRKDFPMSSPIPDEVHIMEMVGYTADNQSTPNGLPDLGSKGDFLGIVGNGIAGNTIKHCGENILNLHAKGLDVPFEMTGMMADVLRSDHAPFWKAGIPATMWTDTSNFRNPNYHQVTDTPDTLDYEFMEKVTKLFISLFL